MDDCPYRIYRVRGFGLPNIVATTDTKEGVGTALVTLGLEGEFDGCTVGVMLREEGKPGTWIVNPWPASTVSRLRFAVMVAPSSGRQHLYHGWMKNPDAVGASTLCGRSLKGWRETADHIDDRRPVCRVCKTAADQLEVRP